MASLDGPRASATVPRQLVVLLHGYGADGRDLIGLAQQFQTVLPDAAFVAPNAPDPCAQSPAGRQWFPLFTRDPDERSKGVAVARPALDAFLDGELGRHGLDDGKLALVGFSQGTMMALHTGLQRARPPAAIVGFSGLLAAPLRPGNPVPPVLLTHGSEDDVIPVDALFMSAEGLAEAGIPCQWHLSAGVAHGIDEGALTHAALFLAGAFGIKPPRR